MTLLCLLGKVYSRMLKEMFQSTVDPQVQEKQCSLHVGCGTKDRWTQSSLLKSCYDGHGNVQSTCIL